MTGQVADIIKELKRSGKTVLIIEHDLPFIGSICDEVVVLDVGKVVLQGTPAEVKESKELKEIYFGADPTTQFILLLCGHDCRKMASYSHLKL